MRLARVAHGHRLWGRLALVAVRLATGHRATDIIRMLFYRPEFFGRHANRWTHAVMRGPSTWAVGERELFAALTSRLNHCVF